MGGKIRKGDSFVYTNTGSAISKGDTVIVGNLICVALDDIAATTGTGVVACEGVFSVTKASGADISQGEFVMWDTSASNFDDSAATPATGDITYGAVAMEDAGTGTTSLTVKLTPGSGVIA